jgi:hypothetical protein
LALWCRAELTEVGEVVRCGGHVASGDDQFGGRHEAGDDGVRMMTPYPGN